MFTVAVGQVLMFRPNTSFVLCSYNKRDTDFPSLMEYNDYLEQVEEIGELLFHVSCFPSLPYTMLSTVTFPTGPKAFVHL